MSFSCYSLKNEQKKYERIGAAALVMMTTFSILKQHQEQKRAKTRYFKFASLACAYIYIYMYVCMYACENMLGGGN